MRKVKGHNYTPFSTIGTPENTVYSNKIPVKKLKIPNAKLNKFALDVEEL